VSSASRSKPLLRVAGAAVLAPEEQLVAAASRLRVPSSPSATVAELAALPALDWDNVVSLAEWQRVPSMLRHNLALAGAAGHAPPAVSERLKAGYSWIVARSLRYRAELHRVVSALGARGIDVMLLKGAALVPDYYADPGLRPMSDLDLLVPEGDVAGAVAVLRDLGYRYPPDSGSEAYLQRVRAGNYQWTAMVSGDGMVAVEIHHHLGVRNGLLDLRLDRYWAGARPVRRGSAECLAPAPEHLLLHVGLHFLHHHEHCSNSALRQLADVALIIESVGSAFDWDIVIDEARVSGVDQALLVVLLVAGNLLGVTVPPEAMAALGKADAYAGFAAEFARRRVFRDPAWVRLERVANRAGARRQLLPPRPRVVWRRHRRAPTPALRMARDYGEWVLTAGHLASSRGALKDEWRFERSLQALITVRRAAAG
jgi:hypothetical protein